MNKQFMTGLARFIRIMGRLILAAIVGIIVLFFLANGPDDKSIGPYQDFVVDDVSKPQQFIISARIIPPVVVRYRIEGMVDDSASVSFQTNTHPYARVNFKGVVADSAVHDFYEMSDMQINYKPKGAKKGHLIIRAALNW